MEKHLPLRVQCDGSCDEKCQKQLWEIFVFRFSACSSCFKHSERVDWNLMVMTMVLLIHGSLMKNICAEKVNVTFTLKKNQFCCNVSFHWSPVAATAVERKFLVTAGRMSTWHCICWRGWIFFSERNFWNWFSAKKQLWLLISIIPLKNNNGSPLAAT